jgi:hypothetical protein
MLLESPLSFDEEGRIHGLTPEGRASVQLMDMKDPERLELLVRHNGERQSGGTVAMLGCST